MMKLAYYIAKHGSPIDRIINRLSCNVGFSHVELVFSDGMFFTSSPRDGGVRLLKIEPDCNHWEFVSLSFITPEMESRMRHWAEIQAQPVLRRIWWCPWRKRLAPRIRYDWNGVLGFLFPIRDNKKRRFCSEEVLKCLHLEAIFPHVHPVVVSPNSLYLIQKATSVGDRMIPISQLRVKPTYNIAAVLRDLKFQIEFQRLVEDIKANGVRQPFIVRPFFQIEDGHLRYLAAREAGLSEIKCYVTENPYVDRKSIGENPHGS